MTHQTYRGTARGFLGAGATSAALATEAILPIVQPPDSPALTRIPMTDSKN